MGNCTASKLIAPAAATFHEDAVALCHERKAPALKSPRRPRPAATPRRPHKAVRSLLCSAASRGAVRTFHRRAVALVSQTARPAVGPLPSCRRPTAQPPPGRLQAGLRRTPQLENAKIESLPAFSSSSSSSSSVSDEKNGEEMRCGYFYSGMSQMPPSPVKDFGWDFFNPFDGVRAAEEASMLAGLCRSSDEDLRVVREKEGIPELEEAEDELRDHQRTNIVSGIEVAKAKEEAEERKERRLTVTEPPEKQRELLDALRDVEDQFIRAYDCGKEVSKMLEINWVDQSCDLSEVKENSSKIIQAITWHRSPSSQSSSRRSYIASSSSSKDTSSVESKSDLFDDFGGMESGSHTQTLGRLYAWEKKLYEEVKAGENTRQAYEKKCLQLRNQQDSKGTDSHSVDKIRAAVRDLYTRIWVALRSVETISTRIQKVRDEELHPQLIELLQGLLRTWKIMLESHETQKQIMSEVKSFSCPAYGKFCSDSQRQVTVTLEGELKRWRSSFMAYVAAQREYVEALDGWLSKFFVPDVEYYSRCRSSSPSYNRLETPPLVIMCHDWANSTKKLPDKAVALAMKGFIKDIRVLWVRQGEEQQQKRKVDSLARELDKRVLAFQKAESKVLESKLSDLKPEPDVRDRMEYLTGRKELLDLFRKKLDAEKLKHHECVKETQRVTLDGFRGDLTRVFESLTEFSKDCLKLYDELLKNNDKTKEAIEMEGKPSCIGGSQVEVDNR
ncbi:uncharacterized protein LOC109838940 [Asparagus officinalis]|uniref:uncharacterized protein LOC109838940 n=1 Tax=Asparagus officinalis TaxID=4686 RepID=UPI00098E286A|nr:uncharacterized protein LOC109838940 [Asparagus officinalis]